MEPRTDFGKEIWNSGPAHRNIKMGLASPALSELGPVLPFVLRAGKKNQKVGITEIVRGMLGCWEELGGWCEVCKSVPHS